MKRKLPLFLVTLLLIGTGSVACDLNGTSSNSLSVSSESIVSDKEISLSVIPMKNLKLLLVVLTRK